jgi:hypothetical protein
MEERAASPDGKRYRPDIRLYQAPREAKMISKEHQITQEDISAKDPYNYKQGDIQPILNVYAEAHREEVRQIHKMYRMVLDDLKYKLGVATGRYRALRVAVDIHNQKMLGNIYIEDEVEKST